MLCGYSAKPRFSYAKDIVVVGCGRTVYGGMKGNAESGNAITPRVLSSGGGGWCSLSSSLIALQNR